MMFSLFDVALGIAALALVIAAVGALFAHGPSNESGGGE
jgi:hypothetical protein